MAQNSSHLRLINNIGSSPSYASGESIDTFQIAALDTLDVARQTRIERAVSQIIPNAAIIGVHVTPRYWDLRPVIVVPTEGVPTVLRFLGPEVSLSESITAHVSGLLKSITDDENLSIISRINEWGTFEEQLWYRRSVLDSTLLEDFRDTNILDFSVALTLARNLIQTVESFHAKGVIHGHIHPSNISVLDSGDISLFDFCAGLAVVQASSVLDIESFPAGYNASCFAPEILKGKEVSVSADVFGLGTVLRELFERLPKSDEKADGDSLNGAAVSLQTINNVCNEMCEQDPVKRPSLTRVKVSLGDRIVSKSVKAEVPANKDLNSEISTKGKMARGKIIQTRRPEPIKKRQPSLEKLAEKAPASKATATEPSKNLAETSSTAAQSQLLDVVQPETPEIKPEKTGKTGKTGKTQSSYEPVIGDSKEVDSKESAFNTKQAAAESSTPEAKPVDSIALQGEQKSGISFDLQLQSNEFTDGLAEVNSTRQAEGKPSKTPPVVIGLALCVFVVIAFILYNQFSGHEYVNYTDAELESHWHSQRPSLMAAVARAAVSRLEVNQFAETLIVSSAIGGEEIVGGVDASLIRIAFDQRWESELSEADRRLALALALTKLLEGDTPADLPNIDSVHPGVILAVTASAGNNVAAYLRNVPAALLATLPPPIGASFSKLVSEIGNLTCGDDVVRKLASFVAHGITDSEDLVQFIDVNPEAGLRSLAILFSQDDSSARRVLNILLNHPNITVKNDTIVWGKTWQLLQWEELSNTDKLFLLSGKPPSQETKLSNIGKMFAHPSPEVRQASIRAGLERIEFKHPGAYEALKLVAKDPSVLAPQQTMQFADLLEGPNKASPVAVRAWLDTSPPVEIVATLVLSTHKQPKATSLDFELSRYLQSQDWTPTVSELDRLIFHPGRLIRFYAYTKAFILADAETAKAILKKALVNEKNQVFVKQLKVMIKNLGNPSAEAKTQ